MSGATRGRRMRNPKRGKNGMKYGKYGKSRVNIKNKARY